MLDFEKVIPEDVGISSTGLISFARNMYGKLLCTIH